MSGGRGKSVSCFGAGTLGRLTVLLHMFLQGFLGVCPFLFGKHPVAILVEFLHNLLTFLLNLFTLLRIQLRTILILPTLELLIALGGLELLTSMHRLLALLWA
jgi:hypothetical protein